MRRMPTIKSTRPTMGTQLNSLRNDIQNAQTAVKLTKGSQVKPASVQDLKNWLDAAIKSPTDGVKGLNAKGVPVGGKQVGLDKKSLETVLTKLDAKVTAEMSKTAKSGDTKRPTQAELKEWVTNAIVEASVGQVKTVAKGGQTRPATADEIRSWLN